MQITKISSDRRQMLRDIKQESPSIASAVEVGTWRGDFSVIMMEILKPEQFFAVDPYALFPGMVSAPGSEYNTQHSLDQLAGKVSARLQALGGKLVRDKSVDACTQFSDNSLDMVYIDGDHTYAGVVQDIESWWPKVKAGGYLCGDDYGAGKTGKGFEYGVVEAVDEFAQEHDLDLKIYQSGQSQWLIKKA